ncbi:conserved uncharacterized protein 35a-like protein-13 [Microplitis demolitor]|nr:conserved uncharacterized protein 35a-like protein-13 [Microplitis demolitor]
MSKPRTNNVSATHENQRRVNGVDIHESIETLIPFTDSIKVKIQEFRTQFKETYKQYLNLIENPQSRSRNQSSIRSGNQIATLAKSRNEFGRKVQYPSFHKVSRIYDTTMKSLGDFMTTFTEDSRDLYSIAIKISSLQQEFDNLVTRYYDRKDDLEVNQLYQINKKIDSIIENHNKLVITYNAGIEHFNALRHNLSNGILIYESTTGKNFVLSRDDDLEEFRRLVEIDEVLQKRSTIYATFASRFKDDLQHSADSTVLMPVRPLKKDNWILQSLEEQNNDASEQHTQNRENPGPFNQEYQTSRQNIEFDDVPEHHMDASVPNVEPSINIQQTYQEPIVTSPPTLNAQSNYEPPLPRIHHRQHHEEPTSSKPVEQMPSSSPNIVKAFHHPMKETTTINFVADKNRDDSQQDHPHTQNYNNPGTSNQVDQPSQQNTKIEEATDVHRGVRNVQHIDTSPPMPSTRSNYKPPPSTIHQRQHSEEAALSKPKDKPPKQMPSSSPNIEKDSQYSKMETPAIKDNEQASPVSIVSIHPPIKTGNRIIIPAEPPASESEAVLKLTNNPELSIFLVPSTRAPVSRFKPYQNLRRSLQLRKPASRSVKQPISSTVLHSKTIGGAANPLPPVNLKTQPVTNVNRESAYPTIKDILARTDIPLVPVSRSLPKQDHNAPSISRKIPSPLDRSVKSHSDIEATKNTQPTPIRDFDVNQSNINPSPTVDENINVGYDQQKSTQSENSEPTGPHEEPNNEKSKLKSESELSFDELSNQSMDIEQSSREPLIINENSNLKAQQNNNEPNQKEESELSEQTIDITDDSDENIITIQESTNLDKSNDSRETEATEEANLPKNLKNILGKEMITTSEINHLKKFLPIFKEFQNRHSHQLREVQSICDDKIIMKGIEGSDHEGLGMEIQKLEKRSFELRRKIKYIGKIVRDITEKINKSEVKEESNLSEKNIDLTDDSNENTITMQKFTNIDKSNDSQKTDSREDYYSTQKLTNILRKDEITESDIEFLKKLLQKIEKLQNHYSNQLDEVQKNYDKITMETNQGSNHEGLEIEMKELEGKRQKLKKEIATAAKLLDRITNKINKSEVNEESNDNQGQSLEKMSEKNVTVMSPPNIVTNQIESDSAIESNSQSDEQTNESSDPEQFHSQDITVQPEVPAKVKRKLSIDNTSEKSINQPEKLSTKISKSDQSKSSDDRGRSRKIQTETRSSAKMKRKLSIDNTSEESINQPEKLYTKISKSDQNKSSDDRGRSRKIQTETRSSAKVKRKLSIDNTSEESINQPEKLYTKISKSDQSKSSDDRGRSRKIQAETRSSAKVKRKLSIDNTSEESINQPEKLYTKISKSDQSKSSDDRGRSRKIQAETRSSAKVKRKLSIDNTSEESKTGSNTSKKSLETTRQQSEQWLQTEEYINLLIKKLRTETNNPNIQQIRENMIKKLLWVNTNLVKFLQRHIYLLSIKDRKIRTIKSLCEKIFNDVIIHATNIENEKIDSSFITPLEIELNKTDNNNKEKKVQLEYLQNKLILSEISYYYCYYLLNQNRSEVLEFELGSGVITNDKQSQFFEAVERMNKNLDVLNKDIIFNKQDYINWMRNKIKSLKAELKLVEKDERKLRINDLRSKIIEIDNNINNKIDEILALKIRTLGPFHSITYEYDKKLKKCETELKDLESAHKKALRKYISSNE